MLLLEPLGTLVLLACISCFFAGYVIGKAKGKCEAWTETRACLSKPLPQYNT